MPYIPKVYRKTGGDVEVTASGGKHEFESGGEAEFQSGANCELLDGATLDLEDGSYVTTRGVNFYDDFIGEAGGSAFDGSETWNVNDVGAATEAVVADQAGGVFALTLTTASETQTAALDMGDQRNFDVSKGLIFEARVNIAVLPSGVGTIMVFGMAGDAAADCTTILEHAFFKLEAGTGVVVIETDDTANDEDSIATGETLTVDTYYVFKIDFTDLEDVKFYIDGTQVATAQTFDLSNLTGAELILQPYFDCYKASLTTVGTMYIDWVLLQAKRE